MNVACRHHFAHATASGGACLGAAVSEGACATAAVSREACSTLHRRVSHWRPACGGYTGTERRDALLGTATGGLSWSRRLRLVRGRDDDRRWEHERLRSGLTTGLAVVIRLERRRGRGIRLRRSQADRARLDCPAGAGGGIAQLRDRGPGALRLRRRRRPYLWCVSPSGPSGGVCGIYSTIHDVSSQRSPTGRPAACSRRLRAPKRGRMGRIISRLRRPAHLRVSESDRNVRT